MDLLPLSSRTQLERVTLRSLPGLIGTRAGAHRSSRRGTSLDFADHRGYVAGDDLRHLDQHALARHDQLVVRLFDAEEELMVRLVIDTSASMGVGTKFDLAKQLGAAIGYVALRGGDIVRVHPLADKTPTRHVGRFGVDELLRSLNELVPEGPTNLDHAMLRVREHPGAPGLTVVISDLLTPQWRSALQTLPHPRRDTVVLHLLHPDELVPDMHGDLDLIDIETGERVAVSVDPRTQRRFEERAAAWADDVRVQCERLGFRYRRVFVGEEPVNALIRDDELSAPTVFASRPTANSVPKVVPNSLADPSANPSIIGADVIA